MFRRITAFTTLIALMVVALAPLATFAAPAKQHSPRQGHGFRKLAPEFDAASSKNEIEREADEEGQGRRDDTRKPYNWSHNRNARGDQGGRRDQVARHSDQPRGQFSTGRS